MEKLLEIDIDTIINNLLETGGKQCKKLTQLQIKSICAQSRSIFMEQPILLQLQAPMKICGDIHGQFSDLIKLFQNTGFPGDHNYVFLGDYVDRGKNSIQCITLLLAYKIKYPENFFLLRGNHQCSSINRIYGFYDECKRKYNLKLWKIFSDVFNVMPVCALIEDKIFCMHGGLSPNLTSFEQIMKIVRPIEIPDEGILCDLLWSDPQKKLKGWGKNDRGVSYIFGEDIVEGFLEKLDLELICRAHQVVQQGYEFFAKKRLVTIFSAPNYATFQNAAAIMNIDQDLVCSFQVLKHTKRKCK